MIRVRNIGTIATEGAESTEQEDASIWFSVFSVPSVAITPMIIGLI
jgi:hypothetical protein